MRRISLITESSARSSEALPAYLFYQGKQSRWINAVIEYMETREFPREDNFFLSHYGKRIIGYEEVIVPYPKQVYHPRKSEPLLSICTMTHCKSNVSSVDRKAKG